MPQVRLYGPNWSAYARTARLALIEKRVAHELVDVDFSRGTMPATHLARHPFGKVPVLEHGDYSIYETSAVCRYIDAAFDGPSLQPTEPRALGRMAQIIAVLDAYLSLEIRMGIVNEGLIKPMMGAAVDEQRLAMALTRTAQGFVALSRCLGNGEFMVSDDVTLADLQAGPLFDYLSKSPGGNDLIENAPRLHQWWEGFSQRPSMLATQPDLTVFA